MLMPPGPLTAASFAFLEMGGRFLTTLSKISETLGREVKLICLPSDNMGDRDHIKMIIYIYYAIYTDN